MSKLNRAITRLNVDIGYVEHGNGRVSVHYPAEEIDTRLDKRIETAMGKLGYKNNGQGYNLITSMRDIGFAKE